jgi:chromate transporter
VVLIAQRAVFDVPTAALALLSLAILWWFKVPEPILVVAAGLVGLAIFSLRGAA